MFVMAFETKTDIFKDNQRTIAADVLSVVAEALDNGVDHGSVLDPNGVKIGSYFLTKED